MNNKEFLRKIENEEKFTEDELSDLAFCGGDRITIVDRIKGYEHRWQVEMKTVIKLDYDRFFAIDWMKGLTECQENEFDYQPYEVEPKEVIIKKTEWLIK